MTSVNSKRWRLHLSVHGFDRRNLAVIAVLWALAMAASRVGIPRVDPSRIDDAGELVTLGVIALVLPVSVCVGGLADGVPWLEGVSPRSRIGLRTLTLAACVGVTAAGAVAWTLALPAGLARVQSVASCLLILSLSLAGLALGGRTWAAVLPFAVCAVFSVRAFAPWGANLFYNRELETEALLIGSALLVLALAAAALGGYGQVPRRRRQQVE